MTLSYVGSQGLLVMVQTAGGFVGPLVMSRPRNLQSSKIKGSGERVPIFAERDLRGAEQGGRERSRASKSRASARLLRY